MNYKELDKYVGLSLSEYGKKVERRDYYKLEKKYAKIDGNLKFDGHGDRSGLMYLVDVSYDTYIDMHIYKSETSPTLKLVFRKDDDELISVRTTVKYEDYIQSFLILVKEYAEFTDRCDSFNKCIIPRDLLRNNKINEVLLSK